MWPWEHLALGYLLYSAWTHLRGRRPPRGREAVVVAIATQFPDLVDKPLGWASAVFPTGRAAMHSLVVAIPIVVVVAIAARRAGMPDVSAAVAVGYLSHLPADALSPVVYGLSPEIGFLLWPLVPMHGISPNGFGPRFVELLGEFFIFVGTPRGRVYLALEVAFLGTALLVWIRDGMPGIGWSRRVIATAVMRYAT